METIPTSPTVEALLANLGWVRGLAYSLVHDDAEADDLTQEAAMIALRRSRDSGTPSRSWFAVVLRNLVRKRSQGESRRQWRELAGAREERVPSARELNERMEHQRVLATAITELEEPYQSTIILRYLESTTAAEIAEMQQVSRATVRSRLMRALAMLRDKLDRAHAGERAAWLPAFVLLARHPFSASIGAASNPADGPGGTGSAPAGAGELAEVPLLSQKVAWIVILVTAVTGLTWRIGFYGGETGTRVGPEESPPMVESPSAQTVAAIPTVPESGRVALKETSAEASRLEVSVVDEQGDPLTGVELLALDENQLVGRVTTDDEGRASFPGSEVAGTLAAWAIDRPVGTRVLDQMKGEHRLELPAGQRVAGRLLVDGEPPASPLTLTLLTNEELLDGIPASVRGLLLELGVVGGERQVVLDEQGRFAFTGLAANWRGELRLPATRWFVEAPPDGSVREGGSEFLDLRRPIDDLELRATRMPSLRGRIVWADSGEGVGDARVSIIGPTVWLGETNGYWMGGFQTEVDERGNFLGVLAPRSLRLPHRSPQLWFDPAKRPLGRGVQITVSSTDGDFEERVVDSPELLHAPGLDVGEIAVERHPGGGFHFLVQDENGVPIEGAVVKVFRSRGTTDHEGRGRIEFVAADRTMVQAGAPGYEARIVERTGAGATREAPEVIMLAPGSRLTLVLQDVEGTAISGRRVTLAVRDQGLVERMNLHDFPDPTELPWWGQELCGGGQIGMWSSTDDGEVQIQRRTDDRGEVLMFNFCPGQPLVVRVEDGPGSLLLEEHLVGPSPGEELVHVLRIPHKRFSLEGVVRDQSGAALPDVAIRLTAGTERERAIGWRRDSSGSDGRYRLERLFPRVKPVLLTAELPGYATARIEELTLTPETKLPELVLERGVSLQVLLVDQLGMPVPARGVTATISGYPEFEGAPLDPGCFVFTDLPPRKMLVRTTVGPHPYEVEHDSSLGDLRWELPTFGTLTVRRPEGTEYPSERGRYIRVTAISADLPDTSATSSFPRDGPSREMWSRPLMLEPGLWKVGLELSWREGSVRKQAPLGPPKEVEVRAGEVTRVEM